MKENYRHLLEYKYALENAGYFWERAEGKSPSRRRQGEDVEALEADQMISSSGFTSVSHLVGTIPTYEKDRLRRLIFRCSKANALTEFKDIVEPF